MAREIRFLLSVAIAFALPAVVQSASRATHSVAHHAQTASSSAQWGTVLTLLLVAILVIVVFLAFSRSKREQAVSENRARSAEIAERLAKINRAQFDDVQPIGIVSMAGERFIYAQTAQHGQNYKERVYRGSNPALYIPLGHGFRYRAASSRGRSSMSSQFAWDAFGTVYVSQFRIAFKPQGRPDMVNIPFSEVTSYDVHSDGLALFVEKIGVQQFRTGDLCLGALFEKMIRPQTLEERSLRK